MFLGLVPLRIVHLMESKGVSVGQNIMIVEERKHAGKLKKRSKQG
jgi:hypothetical protein